MASNTRVAPPSSSHPPVVGEGDAQRLEAVSSGHNDPAGDAKPSSINPLLLASVCCGSSGALKFLFDREDAGEAPMVVPTQAFLDLLVGCTPGSSTGAGLAVPQASDDVENGVHQSVLQVAYFHATEDVVDQPAFPAAGSHNIEDGAAQPAFPATAPHDIEDGVDQPILQDVVSHDIEVPTVSSHDTEDDVSQHDLPSAAKLLQGVTADGDTALHFVASHGDSTEFLNCAKIIGKRDQDLLFAVNRKGDTPLHCAVRAGKHQMIYCLIARAGESRGRSRELLRKENVLKETALHEAVRIGNKDIVGNLVVADPWLAYCPEEGTSPLYLAISLAEYDIAITLHDKSNGNLSYSGPDGQTALHVATFHGTGITGLVLKWKNSLTTHGDRHGSTSLHLASSFQNPISFRQLFEANPAPAYQADNNGFFPIHVAASVGRKNTISILLEKFPSSARLLTAQGRTFLHVAVEKRMLNIVSLVCQTPSLDWILNMRDNDGNTALHLAVQAGKLRIFCSLYASKKVHLDIANNNKETPLDISRSLLPRGGYYNWNNDSQIYRALCSAGAKPSLLRVDHIEEKYTRRLNLEEMIKEAEKVKDLSQMIGIGSVLIATVAFGATFAVPGGFIADDRTNRGTPTLSGRYTFDAFMMANALAFICASITIIALMFSGSSMVNLVSRQLNLATSVIFMSSSVTSLSAAFPLGVYMVLAPVAHATAIAICVLSPLVLLYRNFEFLLKAGILARPICVRTGLSRGLRWLAWMIVSRMLIDLWPYVLIFGWAAIAQKIRNHL